MSNAVPMKAGMEIDQGIERYSQLASDVLGMHQSGGVPRGDSTGWGRLDDLYRVACGQWTVVTGVPGSGKSEFVDALAMNLMETGEWDFAFFSPENYPVSVHITKLLEKHVRKPFSEGPSERMTRQEALDGMEWMFARALWLKPNHASPEVLLEMAAERAGERNLGVVLDPWNTLDHERHGMSETDYVSTVLTKVTHIVRSRKYVHVWLVVHPAKINRNRDGERPVPTPYDISGSAHWFNKADNILCIHRDKGKGTQEVQVLVQKVRFKSQGQVGEATLLYDKVIGTYFEGPDHVIEGERYADPRRTWR